MLPIVVPPIDNTDDIRRVIDYVWDRILCEHPNNRPIIPDDYIQQDFEPLVIKN